MWPILEVYFLPKMKFWPLITYQILIFTVWNWLGSKFGHQKCPKMAKIFRVANLKTITICCLWLSRLKHYSHTVSRLDLPTLLLNLPSNRLKTMCCSQNMVFINECTSTELSCTIKIGGCQCNSPWPRMFFHFCSSNDPCFEKVILIQVIILFIWWARFGTLRLCLYHSKKFSHLQSLYYETVQTVLFWDILWQ